MKSEWARERGLANTPARTQVLAERAALVADIQFKVSMVDAGRVQDQRLTGHVRCLELQINQLSRQKTISAGEELEFDRTSSFLNGCAGSIVQQRPGAKRQGQKRK